MIREALQYIVGLAPTTPLLDAGGRTYYGSGGQLTALRPPTAEPLVFKSLTGFVEYLRDCDGHERSEHEFVMVTSHAEVELLGAIDQMWRRRESLAKAQFAIPVRFDFGRYMDQEAFITAVQAQFVADEARAQVLAVVGNMTAEQSINLRDDGVGQVVTARTGVARVEQVPVPNPVMLRPYRTFPEVEQVQSPFILRIRRDGESGATVALFESADATWTVEARLRVKRWLVEQLGAAEVPVPVIG